MTDHPGPTSLTGCIKSEQEPNEEYQSQARVQAILDSGMEKVSIVLDVGSGARHRFQYPEGARIFAVDLSFEALVRNRGVQHKAVGDAQELPISSSMCDLVVAWYLLEHLPEPDLALREFARVLRPNGTLVLCFPNVQSVKGWLTKHTPLWIHRAAYRFLLRERRAAPFEPFPTVLHPCLAPTALADTFARLGLVPVHDEWYEAPKQRRLREKWGITGWRWQIIKNITRVFGSDAKYTDRVVVLERRPDPVRSESAPAL